MSIKIGTRGSKLALHQTGTVIKKLTDLGIETEQVIIHTEGDTTTQVPLHEIGGQGVFVRALDDAILAGDIDCASKCPQEIVAVTDCTIHSHRDSLFTKPPAADVSNRGQLVGPFDDVSNTHHSLVELTGKASSEVESTFDILLGERTVQRQFDQISCCNRRRVCLCHGSRILVLFSKWPGVSVRTTATREKHRCAAV